MPLASFFRTISNCSINKFSSKSFASPQKGAVMGLWKSDSRLLRGRLRSNNLVLQAYPAWLVLSRQQQLSAGYSALHLRHFIEPIYLKVFYFNRAIFSERFCRDEQGLRHRDRSWNPGGIGIVFLVFCIGRRSNFSQWFQLVFYTKIP